MKPHIVALVPMRHKSERVPGKNYKLFSGKPLYHQIVKTLMACTEINHIVIDTDSPKIKSDCKKYFSTVELINRPKHLRDGSIPMNEVLLYDVSHVEADFYLQTHSTNPLLRHETVSHGVKTFLKNYPINDSLFTVTRLQTRLWNELGRPLNHNPAMLLRTQDLPPIFEENSNIYIFTRDLLEKKHSRIGERPLIFEIDPLEAWDIDEKMDFEIAEFLHLQQQKKSRKRNL